MPSFLGFDYVTPVTIRNNEPRFLTDSQSLRRQSVRTGAQRWEMEISFTGGRNEELHSTMFAHYMANGLETSFSIPMPQNTAAQRRYNAPTTFTATGTAGSNTVTVAATGTDIVIPVGWFIQFSGTGISDKVYMVTEEYTGGTTLNVAPALTEAITMGTDIITGVALDENDTDGVRLSVFHDDTNSTVSYTEGLLQQIGWSFVEAL